MSQSPNFHFPIKSKSSPNRTLYSIRFRIVTAVFCLLILLLSSCSKTPDPDTKKAQTAINEALTAGADRYAKVEFSYAQDLYNELIAEIDQEKKLFPFLRHTAEINRKLDSVVVLAEKAIIITGIEKERERNFNKPDAGKPGTGMKNKNS